MTSDSGIEAGVWPAGDPRFHALLVRMRLTDVA